MTNDRRIKKLYPALTASERVLLILADRQRGEPDDPKIRATTPRDQEREVWRLLRDVGIANIEIGMLIQTLFEAMRAQEWHWRWFEALLAHHNDLAAIGKEAGAPQALPALRPPIDLDALPDAMPAGWAPGVLKGLRDAVVAIADQAYATEVILEEFSGELGGADPLRQEARELLAETEERLGRLIEQLEVWLGPIERGENEDYLTELGRIVEAARRRL
ncbi:MAG: hypothetical protein M3P30_03085 [Chloroflexota bacterium]|nr:hypothetical protein [Chloroflexota bacterium]